MFTSIVDKTGRPVGPTRGKLVDRSGTLAGASAQTIAPANEERNYLIFQNLSASDMWVNFGSAAVAGQPSIKIPSGAGIIFEGNYIPTDYVSVIGTAGGAFTCKEG